ncbi:MAG: heavy-metal-associated domain-containing protein [Desulfovibrio sp.]|nr:heavy-metal-associated domain-containing protein [Desulfovibrio sp.]
MKTFVVKGMRCGHCKAAVEDAAAGIAGVADASADPARGILSYEEAGPVDVHALKKAIEGAGFEVE